MLTSTCAHYPVANGTASFEVCARQPAAEPMTHAPLDPAKIGSGKVDIAELRLEKARSMPVRIVERQQLSLGAGKDFAEKIETGKVHLRRPR